MNYNSCEEDLKLDNIILNQSIKITAKLHF